MRQGGGRRDPPGHRGRLQPGPAQHADVAFAHPRPVGQLRHRPAHRRGGRHRLQAHRPGAQDRCRRAQVRHRAGLGGAALAAGLLAHRRRLQPGHGRPGHQRGGGPTRRETDLPVRRARRARRQRRRRHRAGARGCRRPAGARETGRGHHLLPAACLAGRQARRGARPPGALRAGRQRAAGDLHPRRRGHHGGRGHAGRPARSHARRRGRHPQPDRTAGSRRHPGAAPAQRHRARRGTLHRARARWRDLRLCRAVSVPRGPDGRDGLPDRAPRIPPALRTGS
ncbi:Uncharacterised protein [Bordetella pertussis]|nr:Uncharacterised protein [Bordetella pertussis]